jgi:hypothetical protein
VARRRFPLKGPFREGVNFCVAVQELENGQECRIDAMLTLLSQLETWSEDYERRSCELLGYEGWQIDYWLVHRRSRADA